MKLQIFFAALIAVTGIGTQPAQGADPLPSWNDTDTKKSIIAFVDRVTELGGEAFVPPAERIATFDNDGTLWTEKPTYIHVLSLLDRIKEQVANDPTLTERQPYKAIASKDKAYFADLYENRELQSVINQLVALPFGGMTTDEYETWNRKWIESFKHPKFGVGVKGLIYQPMLELIQYLEANEFKVFIVTADEVAFLRLVSEQLYGLPPHRVQGTHTATDYSTNGTSAELVRAYRVDYLDNWAGKPRLIEQVIGSRPIFAAGNSNGDEHMLQWVALQNRPSFSLLVRHTDDDREFAYDAHTDRVLPLAKKEGWTVVDMKNDWNRIFPESAKD